MSDPSAQLHGPGGLLATPGLSSRRRTSRKWGQRLKAKQIVGNLYRGDTGQFQSGGASTPAGAKPKRGVVLSKQPKPPKRAPSATSAPKKAGGGGKKPAASQRPKDPAAQARQQQRDQERQEDRATRASDRQQRLADRQARLERQAARDQERAKKQQDAAGKRSAAQIEQALAKPKPAKVGGGGGSKKPSDADKRQERSKRALETAESVGISAADLGALRDAAEGLSGAGSAGSAALSSLGLIGPDGLATDQGRRALTALERGDVRQYQAALQDAKNRMGRESAASDRKRQAEGKRTTTANERQAKQQRRLDTLKRRAQSGGTLTTAQRDQLTEAGLAEESGAMWRLKADTYGGTKRANLDATVFAGPDRSFPIVTAQDVRDAVQSLGRTKHDKDAVKKGIIRRARAIGATDALPEEWRAKSFTVFKDHTGQHRWLARTTTAYRDRDGEIISEAALDADSQRMMATKQFGPLRYWHIGQPDPANVSAPWGPGVDIGDCDYSVVIGRTRIESGTFKSTELARQMSAVADKHEMSPGFFHPLDQPDSSKTFNAIRTFERSPVPIRYGRASNLFTGFTVKEFRMEIPEMERRFKAMYQELGLTPEQGAELGQSLLATEKAAVAQGIAFKSDAAITNSNDTGDHLTRAITTNVMPGQRFKALDGEYIKSPSEFDPTGEYYAVKAAPPTLAIEEQAADDPIDAMAEEVIEPEAEMAGDYMGDMTRDEYRAFMEEILAPALKMQDMLKALGDAHAELKTMYGGVAQKDDARAQDLAALKSTLADVVAKITAIEGDQPNTILPNDVAEALKSVGPAAPAEPERPEITDVVNDPDRPWAGWAMHTYPKLYEVPNGS
jgi:hypothetical protein